MRTLWIYFRVTLALAAGALFCAVLAWDGMRELERRRPPAALELDALQAAAEVREFTLTHPARLLIDLEIDAEDATAAILCAGRLPCQVAGSRLPIEWRIEDAARRVLAGGNLATSGSALRGGTFHWLELGSADLPAGRHRFLIRANHALPFNAVHPRIRFWRGDDRDGPQRTGPLPGNDQAHRVSSWTVGAFLLAFLTLLSAMLEHTLWQRRRARR